MKTDISSYVIGDILSQLSSKINLNKVVTNTNFDK